MPLFDRFGIEIEYMIVDRERLDVLPVSDQVLAGARDGQIAGTVEFDDITWSNELVLHVLEFKVSQPAPALTGLPRAFQAHVGRANDIASSLGGQLLPSGMHPWMDPLTQTRIWPHEYNPVYEAFNRIFDCRGHGWSNLQSMHINLPFEGDEQFGRLHAAVRLVLPIIPGLAASSPVRDGRLTGMMDSRLDAYRHNCERIPSVGGQVIPEPVFTVAEYHERILQRIYRDLAPFDPEGVLQNEWSNARGAIARFDRNAIEIRLIDTQECPGADLAVAAAVIGAVRLLADEAWCSLATLKGWATEPLAKLLDAGISQADRAEVADLDYLADLGLRRRAVPVGQVWSHLIAEAARRYRPEIEFALPDLRLIERSGPLARRLESRLGPQPSRQRLAEVYGQLAGCLRQGRLLGPC